MAQNKYEGKWSQWIHMVSNGRWIVGEKRGDYWFSKNAELPVGQEEIRGHNPLDLVGKGAITYASPNTAIRALKRVYNPDEPSEARPEG
jgi:hypothetical protein